MTRTLCIDFGKKRLGIAVSDPLNITAQSVEVITRTNIKKDLHRIKSIVEEYKVSKIIIGLPLNMDGTKGISAEDTENFGKILKKEIAVKIEFLDERLSTAQGERILLEADVSRQNRKKYIDKISAQLILQNYMEMHSISPENQKT
jgi:putative Holliday junction resolvase